jgi:hypothetical protein
MRFRIWSWAVAVACATAFAFAAPAVAQTPSQDAYSSLVEQQQSSSPSEPSDGSSATSSSDALPFTGLDVGLALVVGLGLVGVGFVLRRGTRLND